MARVIDAGLPVRRRAVRLSGPWAWALAGLVVVAAAVALDPVAEPRPAGGEAVVGASVPDDWRGNSGRVPDLR